VLEILEGRKALAISPLPSLGGSAAALSVVVRPTFERITNPASEAVALFAGESAVPSQAWGSSTPSGLAPAQLQVAYGINDIRFASSIGDGAGQTIAIVDAYDDPKLVASTAPGFLSSDLAMFDQSFGLPNPPSFLKLNEYGGSSNLPGTDPAGPGNSQGNWEVEEALDVEWAHAMAPEANIVLIECQSGSGIDMYQGARTAAGLAGVSVVSMSWGSNEFNGETSFDGDFTTPNGHQGVTFVASTGDQGAPGEYPAYSPNVLAVGGTSLYLNASGSYSSEAAWSGSGGGSSEYETEPGYQAGVAGGGKRTIPDVSSDANPNTGVAVYDSYNGTSAAPWEQVGGTSLSAPTWAGLIAIANQGRVASGSSTLDGRNGSLSAIYAISQTDFHDVTTGGNGGFKAGAGYDMVTGIGSPKANLLVPDLVAYGSVGRLAVQAQPPGSSRAGGVLGVSILVENAAGALEQDFDGSVTVSLGSDPAGGILGGAVTVTAHNGVAAFSGLTLTSAGAGYTLLATAGSAAVTTSSFSITAGSPAKLAVISEPSLSVGVGQTFGLSVAVEDRFGNVENTYAGIVTAALASGPGARALGGTLTINVQNGVAVFSNLTLSRAGLGYSIKVTSPLALASTKTTLFGVVSHEKNIVDAKAKARVGRTGAGAAFHPRFRRLERHV